MDVLSIYDVVAAELTTAIDIGTVAASTSDDTLLRVFNASDSYQAEDVTVSLTGANENQLYLSLDGDSYAASINVGDIPPGAYSPQFTLRRVTHYQVGAGTYTAVLVATATAWISPTSSGSSDNIPLDTSDS
jgi:hypothetical protein